MKRRKDLTSHVEPFSINFWSVFIGVHQWLQRQFPDGWLSRRWAGGPVASPSAGLGGARGKGREPPINS